MTIVLIIATIGILLYGYLLMHRIDSYFQQRSISTLPVAIIQKDILLYGNPNALKTLCKELDSAGMSFDCVNEPKLCAHTTYRWAGAFSDSDIDNLQLCKAAKRGQEYIGIAAKCNNALYENIYKHLGVSLILHKDFQSEKILACFKGQEHVYHREV